MGFYAFQRGDTYRVNRDEIGNGFLNLIRPMTQKETQQQIDRLEQELQKLKDIVNQPEVPNYKSITTIEGVNKALDRKWFCSLEGNVAKCNLWQEGNNMTEKEAASVGAYRDLLNVAHLANGGVFKLNSIGNVYTIGFLNEKLTVVASYMYKMCAIQFQTKEAAEWALANFRPLFEKYYQL